MIIGVEAGLSVKEIKRMHFYDFWISVEGYQERIKQLFEIERLTWYYIHAHSMADSKHKKRSPQALHPFGWEKQSKTNRLPLQQVLDNHRKMKAERKQNNAG